jgi:hypothetical protein
VKITIRWWINRFPTIGLFLIAGSAAARRLPALWKDILRDWLGAHFGAVKRARVNSN